MLGNGEVSAPADQDASQIYYSSTHSVPLAEGGAGEREKWEGDPSRSYAVSAPADQDASQLYYQHSWRGGCWPLGKGRCG